MKAMFNNARYLTRGVQAEIPIELQIIMWDMLRDIDCEVDYIQFFKLSEENGRQVIEHTQECPVYSSRIELKIDSPVTQKVYIIDDGDHSTMLLAEEY